MLSTYYAIIIAYTHIYIFLSLLPPNSHHKTFYQSHDKSSIGRQEQAAPEKGWKAYLDCCILFLHASRCMKTMLLLLSLSKYRVFRGDLRKGTATPHESKGWKKLHSKGITEEPTCRGFLMNLK